MKKKINTIIGKIDRSATAIISLIMICSFSMAKSKVIINGNSSIIIESRSEKTNLFVENIEKVNGGMLIHKNYSSLSDSKSESIPRNFVIEKAYPNPFNPTTNIKYGIENTSDIDIVIYDMNGKIVSVYYINAQSPGWHQFIWDGTDVRHQQVSTGIYLVTIRAGENILRQKVTFLK